MSVALERVSEDDWEALQRDIDTIAGSLRPPLPQARVFNNAPLAIPNNVVTALTFNAEHFDNGALHSLAANTHRLTAQVTGLYMVGGTVEFPANAAGLRSAQIRYTTAAGVGPLTIDADAETPAAGLVTIFSLGTLWQMFAGDWVDFAVFQTSGGALNANFTTSYSPEFWMYRVGGYTNEGIA